MPKIASTIAKSAFSVARHLDAHALAHPVIHNHVLYGNAAKFAAVYVGEKIALTADQIKQSLSAGNDFNRTFQFSADKKSNFDDMIHSAMQIDDYTLDESNDMSISWTELASKAASVGEFMLQSYINGHNEKVSLSNDMFVPVIDEIKSNAIKLLALSEEEKSAIITDFKEVKGEHKDNRKTIKQVSKGIAILHALIDKELTTALQGKVTPSTLEKMISALKTTTNISSKCLKFAGPLNNVYMAYQAAALLYPEQVGEMETYVQAKLEKSLAIVQDHFSKASISAVGSFKDKLTALKDTHMAQTLDVKKPNDDTPAITIKSPGF